MRFPPAPLGQVQCPRCGLALATAGFAGAAESFLPQDCPRCRAPLLIQVFPAIHRQERTGGPGLPAVEGEATCFFHPGKRADAVCDRCGRFLCALCDLPMGTRRVCPKCLSGGLDKESPLPELLSRRVSWGRLALLIAFLPILFGGPFVIFLFFITAPAAIFCAIYGWNKPGSLVHGRRRFSAILGGALGLAEIAFLVGLGYYIWADIANG